MQTWKEKKMSWFAPLSDNEIEQQVSLVLNNLIQSIQTEYSTTLEEDEQQLLDESLTYNSKLAIRNRS